MAGNLVKPLLSLYGTEWRERGYGLRGHVVTTKADKIMSIVELMKIVASSENRYKGKQNMPKITVIRNRK